MNLPPKDATELEIIEFLDDYNKQIHNAILEEKDYSTLINDLVGVNMWDRYLNLGKVIEAMHLSKVRYYAGTRDITHEINYIMDKVDTDCNDWDNIIDDINMDTESFRENVIEHKYETGDIVVDYMDMIDKLTDFPIYEDDLSKTLKNLKEHIQEMEKMYASSIRTVHLSLKLLTAQERKILKKSENSSEVIALITELINRWGKKKKDEAKKKDKEFIRDTIITGKNKVEAGYKINTLLENIGVYRKQYYRFLHEDTYPTKMLVLAIALYLIPNNPDRIEEFMNVFGYSINSNIMFITHRDISPDEKIYMYDRDVRKLLSSGLDTEIIVMLLAEKNNKVKKSSSSKNFS